ncbi:MAG: hypothetical protein AB4080_23095 [Trichodesmium sp.]
MSDSQKLESWKKEKKELEEQIAVLENLRNNCHQQFKGEGDSDKREQLRVKMKNYSKEVEVLYDEIDNIEKKINQIQLDDKSLSSNDHLDNPNNQQQLKLEKSLCYIDFDKALAVFRKIMDQLNGEGDVALFLMEERFFKQGDLCLQRLRDDLVPSNPYFYRQHFRHCTVKYTSGNLEEVIQGIANFFEVKQEEVTIENFELVINKIGSSLQNNSVLFIEIYCDISNPSDIFPLITWFINVFWKALREKVNEVAKDYEGIKVVAVIISEISFNSRFSKEELSCYYNPHPSAFSRDKLVKIPLNKWTKKDIAGWLGKYGNPSLKKTETNSIAEKIYNATDKGTPTAVCLALQQKEWQTLIYPTPTC